MWTWPTNSIELSLDACHSHPPFTSYENRKCPCIIALSGHCYAHDTMTCNRASGRNDFSGRQEQTTNAFFMFNK